MIGLRVLQLKNYLPNLVTVRIGGMGVSLKKRYFFLVLKANIILGFEKGLTNVQRAIGAGEVGQKSSTENLGPRWPQLITGLGPSWASFQKKKS